MSLQEVSETNITPHLTPFAFYVKELENTYLYHKNISTLTKICICNKYTLESTYVHFQISFQFHQYNYGCHNLIVVNE